MKNPQLCNQINNFSNCSQLSLTSFLNHDQSWWLNYMKIDNMSFYSQIDVSNDTSYQHKYISVDEVYEIISLIDRSKLILRCLTRQNINIRQSMMKEYKSQMNYEKIKLIDLIKLLISNKETIAAKLKQLRSADHHLLQEVVDRISELDQLSIYCVELQINEVEITSEFRLSTEVVDCILNDCGLDLSEIDRFIYNKFTDFDNKLQSAKGRQQSRPEKCRMERQCEQMIHSLQSDICRALTTMERILERLIRGHCGNMVDAHYFQLTEAELQRYTVEIGESQLRRVVELKIGLVQMEDRVNGHIVALREWQISRSTQPDGVGDIVDCDGRALSPIGRCDRSDNGWSRLHKRSSIVASTPETRRVAVGRYSLRNGDCSLLHRESLAHIREKSLSSHDSGFLLTPDIDPSLEDSGDDFDIIPFSDDEYEKIEDDGGGSVFEQESISGDSLNVRCDNETESDLIQFCNENAFCHINRTNQFLFVFNNDTSFRKRNALTPPTVCMEKITWTNSSGFNIDHINNFQLSPADHELLTGQIHTLLGFEKCELNFCVALRMMTVNMRQNPFVDMKEILEYLERIFHSFSTVSKGSNSQDGTSNVTVDNQYNNSACSFSSIHKSTAMKTGEQNTNNNADSKDDDSSELHEEMELRNAFRNILSDSTSTEHSVNISECSSAVPFNDQKFSSYRDITVNVNNTIGHPYTDNLYDSASVDTDISLDNSLLNNNGGLGFIEDIELVVKLSELHIRSEFQAEEYYKSTITHDKNRIVDNYKNLTSQIQKRLNNNSFSNYQTASGDDVEVNRCGSHSPNRSKSQVQIQTDDNGDDIDPNHFLPDTIMKKKQFCNNSIVEFSMDASETHSNTEETNTCTPEIKKIMQEDSTVNWFNRIFVTIKLINKLLKISNCQLNFISSLFHKNSASIKSTMTRNKSFSTAALRQRLNVTLTILSNLKNAIQCTYSLNIYEKTFSKIDQLIDQSSSLVEFSFVLENSIKKNGCEIDKIDSYNFEHELPDDLLIKMDPNEFEIVLSISTRRLQRTIAALSQYPCYNHFLRLSLPKPDALYLNHNIGSGFHHSQLLQTLFKLRRITAICALNIVDLHVLLTKLENDNVPGYSGIEADVKNLLIFWRVVDGECHRLLRCTSLVHHIMTDTRRSYIDLVSLLAVMNSIIHSVKLSKDESTIMKTNVNTLTTYKQRILDWLGEVDMCISIINKKRMTKKRFKFYDEIHNYLEENLTTISELAERIKNGCHKTVLVVNDILTYCSNLPNNSIAEIDQFLTTDVVVDEHLFHCDPNNPGVNENLFNVIIDLEKSQHNFTEQMADLFIQGKDTFEKFIYIENSENMDTLQDISRFSNTTELCHKEMIAESAITDISNKISKIAACAATNALLLFVDKCGFTLPTDDDMAHPIGSSHEDIGSEVGLEIIEEISALIIGSLAQSLLQLRDGLSSMSSEIIFLDICREISGQTLEFLVNHITLDRQPLGEIFTSDTSTEITNYLWEELGCLMMIIGLEERVIVDLRPDNGVRMRICPSTHRNDLLHGAMEHCQVLLSPKIDKTPTELYSSSSKPPQKQTYDPNEVVQSVTRLFHTKVIVSSRQATSEKGKENEKLECPIFKCPPARNNKITKLVAQFSQNLFAADTVVGWKSTSPIVKLTLERISLNLLNVQAIQIIELLAVEAVRDAQLSYVTSQLLDSIDSDRYSLDLINVHKSIIVGIVPQHPVGTSSNQIHSQEILSFCHWTSVATNLSPMCIHSGEDTFTAALESTRLTGINESSSGTVFPFENTDCPVPIAREAEDNTDNNTDNDNDNNLSYCTTVHEDDDQDNPLSSGGLPLTSRIVNFSAPISERNRGECYRMGETRSSDLVEISEDSLPQRERLEGNRCDDDAPRRHILNFHGNRIVNTVPIVEDGQCRIGQSTTVPMEIVPEESIDYLVVVGRTADLWQATEDHLSSGTTTTTAATISRSGIAPPSDAVTIGNEAKVPGGRRRRSCAIRWWLLVVMLFMLVLTLVAFGRIPPFYRWFHEARLTQSFYPKVTSNRLPV